VGTGLGYGVWVTTPILSASQVATFGTIAEGGNNEGCQRKWAFKYIAKLPDISGASAEAGKEIHSLIELWLRDSQFPNGANKEANTARAMIKYLPEPSPELRVEEPFTLDLEGVKWRGLKDLTYWDGSTLVVHDNKTTSDLKWAKTEEDLRHDAQAILYARHAFQEADTVDLSWLYGTRAAKPQVLPVRFNISYDEVAAAMPPLTRTGKRMLALYDQQPDPNSLDPNLAMCDAYGGCQFKASCNITPIQRIKSLQQQHKKAEEAKMGFRDRIKQGSTDQDNGVSVAPSVNTTFTATKPTMREKLQGFGSAITPPPPPAVDVVEEALPPPPETAALPPPAKRGPGRPRKVAEVVHVHNNADTFTLYVNCAPSTPYTTLAKYLEPILDAINTEHGVQYYGQIDYKAAGILGAALYTALQANPPIGSVVMDARTKEGADCLSTLERFAALVVRGF
jgi:hypothetical protein